jgi:hypothetical protein
MSVSASQVDTACLCLRKWAWQSLARIYVPQHPSAELGEEVHHRLELYQKGTPDVCWNDNAGRIASRAIPHLPEPGGHLVRIEQELDRVVDGVRWKGRKDLEFPSGELWTVVDYKTTGNLKYAKTEETLASNVQALIYAYDTMLREETTAVGLLWLYLHTKSKAVQPVRARLQLEDTIRSLRPYLALASEMERARARWPFLVTDLPPPFDLSACSAYGGCPFENRCNLTLEDRICARLTKGNISMSDNATQTADLLAKLNQLNLAIQALPQASAPSASPPVASVPITPPPVLVAPVVTPPPVAPPSVTPPPVTPPTVPLPAAVLVTPSAVAATTANNGSEVPATETPKKRGRPAGSRNKATPAAAAVDTPATTSTPEPAPTGYTLYVNCLPVGEPVQELAEYIAPIHAEFCAAAQAQHYRFIDYGKGPALFADFLARRIEADPPQSNLVLDIRTQSGSDLYATLAERAHRVVRGVA